ncbi:hypothetical protein BDK51DRAFT_34884, partial [Blyttiomyces helicus]
MAAFSLTAAARRQAVPIFGSVARSPQTGVDLVRGAVAVAATRRPLPAASFTSARFAATLASPFQPLPDFKFNLTPEDIAAFAGKIVQDGRKTLDAVAAVADPSFNSVVRPLALLDAKLERSHSQCSFLQHCHTDANVREASTEADKVLNAFLVEYSMHAGVFEKMTAVEARREQLDEEGARFLSHSLRDFRRTGLGLPKEQRDVLKDITNQINNLSTDFSTNMGEDKTECLFTREELDGLPDDYFEGREKKVDPEDGVEKFVVTMKYPDVGPVMRMGKVEATRRSLNLKSGSRCKDNIEIVQK